MIVSPMRVLSIVLIAVICAPMTASAHQLQVAISTVRFIPRTATIEIIHRFYSHDAEHALSSMAGRRVDILRDDEQQQAFGRYLSVHFQLRDQGEKAVPLSLVGVELDGDFIWVYQETPFPGELTGLTISNSALLDEIPGQVNTVNVECADDLETLQFSEESTTARAEINFSACSKVSP
ncbi:DUF6702 family protein [Pseudomonadota bacterium]